MIDQNLKGPENLIVEFKRYEYILNVNKKALIEDLFKGKEEEKKDEGDKKDEVNEKQNVKKDKEDDEKEANELIRRGMMKKLKELNSKKKSLNDIRNQIQHYHQAYYDIMTLKEDIVNFKIFRVVTKKMKETLGDEASKIKEKILDATY